MLCQCPNPGWCKVHNMSKVGALHEICRDEGPRGAAYWEIWEKMSRGEPTMPAEPVAEKPKPQVEPGLARQAMNLLTASLKHLSNGLATVNAEDKRIRLDICATCPHFTEDSRCAKCGCYISLKAEWAGEQCPIGKWPELTKPQIPIRTGGCEGCGKKQT